MSGEQLLLLGQSGVKLVSGELPLTGQLGVSVERGYLVDINRCQQVPFTASPSLAKV